MASSDETKQFLESLYQEAAKDDEIPEETARRVSNNLRGFSRRDAVKLGGGGLFGALLGGGSYAATQSASADASTSDSDGNIGTPSDPVDLFADGANIYDGANNQIGSLDENGLDIPVVSTGEVSNDDYHESVVSGNVSGTTGLDLSSANLFKHTLTGNTTFAFNNPSSTPPGNSFTLVVQQDSTGGHTISWPSSVQWDSGSAPGLTTNAGDKHMLAFISPDGGTTWIGVVSATEVS